MKTGNTITRQITITKTLNYLNYCRTAVDNKNFSVVNAAKMFNVSHTTFYTALKLNYFERNEIGRYKCKYNEFTEDEAIRVIRFYYKRNRDLKKEKLSLQKQITIDYDTKLTEDSCVKYLKELGYKIYKPITQFEEI